MDGPGPNTGGGVDFLTKRPSLSHMADMFDATLDTEGNRRWMIDVGGPVLPGELGFRVSYSGEDSVNTFFTSHYMRKEAFYTALRWQPNDNYKLDFNAEINREDYTENVGVNRVNQQLLGGGAYLQGGILPGTGTTFGNVIFLTDNGVKLNPRTTLDEAPGVGTKALIWNAQLIQTYNFGNDLSFENNTFFAYQDSENHEPFYYSDASRGSFSIENRTDLIGDYAIKIGSASIKNQYFIGASFRLAHTNYVSNYDAEPADIYDLTGQAKSWVLPSAQGPLIDDAYPFVGPFGHILYGNPGRDVTNNGNSGISDLYDTALFFQDRTEFSPQFSLLFGACIDAVQNHTRDPFGGTVCQYCYYESPSMLPESHTTGVYGLGEFNTSLVYKPRPWLSSYLTFDWTQATNTPNGGEGGLNTYGQVRDSFLMRQDNFLYEAGLKANLLDNRLFVGTAVFDQKHRIPVGFTGSDAANIRGVEIELNYQPTRNLFVTASYSYVKTTLSQPVPFYDFPAAPGYNIDGAGNYLAFTPNQVFKDPGVPEHLFNVLANYQFPSGFGIRSGIQVTGPITTSTSGAVDIGATTTAIYNNIFSPGIGSVPASQLLSTGTGGSVRINPNNPNVGYYVSPVIPWQYTWNLALFYDYKQYTFTLSVYNVTNQRNWSPSFPYYGNDFVVLSDPRTFEARLQAKF